MDWKEHLSIFESSKDWDSAIILLQNTISRDDSNVDAYLRLNYLLMNLLIEEQYNQDLHEYYAGLLKKYFDESYSRFCDDPEYLFFIGKIACIAEWYYDIDIEEAQSFIKKAHTLEPQNILYKWAVYNDLDMRDTANKEKMNLYAKNALSDAMVRKQLESKGSLGEYLLEALKFWSTEDALRY